MPVQIDSRPQGIHHNFRPGLTLTVDLDWQTPGVLVGRTFTSTLNGVAMGVSIVGDVMTLEATQAETAAIEDPVEWLLLEDRGGVTPEAILMGTWVPSDQAALRPATTTVVTDQAVTVQVTVSLGGLTTATFNSHIETLHLPFVAVPAGWGGQWEEAREEADTRQVKVHLHGDSIYQGVGATNPRTEGCAILTGDELRDRYGDGGTGWIPSALRTSATGVWTSGMGMGGCQLRATNTATLAFTDLRGSALRIFHRNASITGSFRWRVNGGSYTTVTPPTVFGQDPGAVEINPGGNGPHTLDVEWVSGTVDIFGVEATFTTGVVTYQFAQSGRAASDYTPGLEQFITGVSASGVTTTITTPGAGSFTNSMIGKFIHGPAQIAVGTTITAVASDTSATISAATTGTITNQSCTISTNGTIGVLGANMVADPFLAAAVGRPDLVIIQLGANDPAGAFNSADTFRAGVSKVMRLYSGSDQLDYVPTFVLVIEHIANWFDIQSEYAAMAAVLADLAGGNGAALVDIWGIGHRSFKYWNDLGMFADTIHPTTAGHAAYAAPVIDLLTR